MFTKGRGADSAERTGVKGKDYGAKGSGGWHQQSAVSKEEVPLYRFSANPINMFTPDKKSRD